MAWTLIDIHTGEALCRTVAGEHTGETHGGHDCDPGLFDTADEARAWAVAVLDADAMRELELREA